MTTFKHDELFVIHCGTRIFALATTGEEADIAFDEAQKVLKKEFDENRTLQLREAQISPDMEEFVGEVDDNGFSRGVAAGEYAATGGP